MHGKFESTHRAILYEPLGQLLVGLGMDGVGDLVGASHDEGEDEHAAQD